MKALLKILKNTFIYFSFIICALLILFLIVMVLDNCICDKHAFFSKRTLEFIIINFIVCFISSLFTVIKVEINFK